MPETVTISVSMPAAMRRQILARVESRFFGNISEYFRHLIREDLECVSPVPRSAAEVDETQVAQHRVNYPITMARRRPALADEDS